MARTRAQTASQNGRNSPDENLLYEVPRDASVRRSPRLKTPQPSPNLPLPSTRQEPKRTIEDTRDFGIEPSAKRRRLSSQSASGDAQGGPATNNCDPIEYWTRKGHWPHKYSKPGMEYIEHALARKRSSSVLGRKRSNSATSATPSDQRPREEKSAPYRDPRYETLLATKGSFMVKSTLDVATEVKELCRMLLEEKPTVPKESLFRDDIFELTCQKIHNKNEARVIQDVSRLIVPSAESLATFGSTPLEELIESVNEGWNNSVPLTGTRPQPDYSVGFRREAFTDEQLAKLSPFIGEFLTGDLSLFMATYYMYFPFMACEVKCGAAALDVADRQNAHSMTLAARGIVELFRLVKREEEVNRQVLSFSISHDHCSVRIYGYYPVINGNETKYYRHPIHKFDFTALDGREKWTAYRFTRNVYNTWMPEHLKKIRSAIDQLPAKLDFDVPALSDSTGLSQSLQSHHLESLGAGSALSLADEDEQQREGGQMATPDTSFSKPAPAKRRRSPVKRP
ncbi:hypothetical protein PG994_010197 [Apiospora phragmitis]|uniref:DUF7924 domain-containing protein n=1 Tax=Apiospora phragmitis TaxID=2905665 RepID=A0ABR1TPD3_9PEZI